MLVMFAAPSRLVLKAVIVVADPSCSVLSLAIASSVSILKMSLQGKSNSEEKRSFEIQFESDTQDA